MKTVHVVAWEFNHGGGFYWFHKPEDADAEFEAEKGNCNYFDSDNWRAVRYDVEVTSYETAEDEIDANIEALFDQATIRYPV